MRVAVVGDYRMPAAVMVAFLFLWLSVVADNLNTATHANDPHTTRTGSDRDNVDSSTSDRNTDAILDLIMLCVFTIPLAITGWTVLWLCMQRCVLRIERLQDSPRAHDASLRTLDQNI